MAGGECGGECARAAKTDLAGDVPHRVALLKQQFDCPHHADLAHQFAPAHGDLFFAAPLQGARGEPATGAGAGKVRVGTTFVMTISVVSVSGHRAMMERNPWMPPSCPIAPSFMVIPSP